MKTFITILISILFGIAYSQEKKPVKTEMTCETGSEKAKNDFNKGHYFCESFGLLSEKDPEFSEFYEKYLLEKYCIISTNGGCIITDYRKCYSKTMEKLVLEKFGTDIFEKSIKEAKVLFYKNKPEDYNKQK